MSSGPMRLRRRSSAGSSPSSRARESIRRSTMKVAHLTAAAADEASRNRVGVDQCRLGLQCRETIGADHVTQDVVALAEARRRICADVVQDSHAHAAQACHLHWRRAPPRPTSPCEWAVVWVSSVRVATQRTGRPSRRARAATRISSGYTWPLAPNPPPTSGASTRTSSGRGQQQRNAVAHAVDPLRRGPDRQLAGVMIHRGSAARAAPCNRR